MAVLDFKVILPRTCGLDDPKFVYTGFKDITGIKISPMTHSSILCFLNFKMGIPHGAV